MSDVTNNTIDKEINTTEENEEIAAFKADLHLADYMERVEKGLLTDEEKACRKAIRDFIGVK